MDKQSMIEDLINMLDTEINKGTGHINVEINAALTKTKEVQTVYSSDCSKNPLACSVPTLHQGLDN